MLRTLARIVQNAADIARAMQDSPYIDMVVTGDVEDHPVMPLDPHGSKTGQVQLMRPPRRAGSGAFCNPAHRGLHSIDETNRGIAPCFTHQPVGCLFQIAARPFAQDDATRRHSSGCAGAQIVEESFVRDRSNRRLRTIEQQPAQPFAFAVPADQLADIFAGIAIATRQDLTIDPVTQLSG